MDFFSKHDQTHCFLRIWSHWLKKSLTENFIFCAVFITVAVVRNKFLSTESFNVWCPLKGHSYVKKPPKEIIKFSITWRNHQIQ